VILVAETLLHRRACFRRRQVSQGVDGRPSHQGMGGIDLGQQERRRLDPRPRRQLPDRLGQERTIFQVAGQVEQPAFALGVQTAAEESQGSQAIGIGKLVIAGDVEELGLDCFIRLAAQGDVVVQGIEQGGDHVRVALAAK
jgi:hypothetical protein